MTRDATNWLPLVEKLVGKPIQTIVQPLYDNGAARFTKIVRGELVRYDAAQGLRILVHDTVRGPVWFWTENIVFIGLDPYPSRCLHCEYAG